MNALYQTKFNELFREFTRYLVEHPKFSEHIPDNAQVVLLDQHDPEYSRHAIESAHTYRKTDDIPDRPVIYIKVT